MDSNSIVLSRPKTKVPPTDFPGALGVHLVSCGRCGHPVPICGNAEFPPETFTFTFLNYSTVSNHILLCLIELAHTAGIMSENEYATAYAMLTDNAATYDC